MEIKCPKCNYEWDCNSKLIFITCPSCMRKIINSNIKLKGNVKK